MKSKVLKPFGYAEDHINVVQFAIGEEHDFGDCTEGLTAEGYVAKVNNPAVVMPQQESAKISEPVIVAKRTYTKRQ